jgi:hypothetical protein
MEIVGVAVICLSLCHTSRPAGAQAEKSRRLRKPKNLHWESLAVGVGVSGGSGHHQDRNGFPDEGRNIVAWIVDRRANGFELVDHGRNRRMLALADCQDEEGLIRW